MADKEVQPEVTYQRVMIHVALNKYDLAKVPMLVAKIKTALKGEPVNDVTVTMMDVTPTS
jgi:hypothetical protein